MVDCWQTPIGSVKGLVLPNSGSFHIMQDGQLLPYLHEFFFSPYTLYNSLCSVLINVTC